MAIVRELFLDHVVRHAFQVCAMPLGRIFVSTNILYKFLKAFCHGALGRKIALSRDDRVGSATVPRQTLEP